MITWRGRLGWRFVRAEHGDSFFVQIMLWHVHGSWTTAFVQGPHTYLLPTLPERGPWGGGRPTAWDWPAGAVEVSPAELADRDVDVVLVQRRHELELAQRWLGRTPGRDVPLIWLEHNAPRPHAVTSRHPAADRDDLLLVHVTPFNAVMWDAGTTPTAVVEHGVLDPGHRFTGELPAAAAVVNEPLRRGRVTGTDLLAGFADEVALDVFGMGTDGLGAALGRPDRLHGRGDLPQHRMHAELARRRAYLHPIRWTSLGLSLIEAMLLGLPAVAFAATEVPEAVPPGTGVCSTDPARLRAALREYVADPQLAAAHGRAGRAHALGRYGVDRFLRDWDGQLERVRGWSAGPGRGAAAPAGDPADRSISVRSAPIGGELLGAGGDPAPIPPQSVPTR